MNGTDLLGDPVAPTPAMTDPLPWRVFSVSDYEWWVARTLDEAIASAAACWGYSVDDPELKEMTEDACEVSEAGMDKYKFRDDDEDPPVTRTFREQLARLVAAGITGPGMFAGTED